MSYRSTALYSKAVADGRANPYWRGAGSLSRVLCLLQTNAAESERIIL